MTTTFVDIAGINSHFGNEDIQYGLDGNDLLGGGTDDRAYLLDGGVGNDELFGVSFADILLGGEGNDSFDGRGGNDRLDGGDGNDSLNGGSGADRMMGGDGNDQYVVDNRHDLVLEHAAGGHDIVFAKVSFTLPGNVEELLLDSSAGPLNGTGNALANVISGSGAANILRGAAGNDLLKGNGGNDTLVGGSGKDAFLFVGPLGSSTNVDRILDFSVPSDTIELDRETFTDLPKSGVLAASIFVIGGHAHDANDRIIYNPATGALFYDSNGNGAGHQVHFATLTPHLALTHADFFLFAN
jgi:serralysin